MSSTSFTVIGGDLRSAKLANFIAMDGNKVNIFGFKDRDFEINLEEYDDLNCAIADSNAIIGPVPCVNDNQTLNAPFSKDAINFEDIFKLMNKNQIFIAGKITEKIQMCAKKYDVKFVDLLEREEMAVLNAIPTAEGAISIAMQHMPITLHHCNSLVLGFGRIGKILSKMLHGIGSNVFVEARKYHDIAWINSYGYNSVFINELPNYFEKMDVIFNTIPEMILGEKQLSKIRKDTLIVDLASKPGGVDLKKAKELDIKTIWALSLPGKVAPETSAKFIKDTIYNIMGEMEVER